MGALCADADGAKAPRSLSLRCRAGSLALARRRLQPGGRLDHAPRTHAKASHAADSAQRPSDAGPSCQPGPLLLRLLALRFGTLPAEVHTRISSASADELERFGERVLTANSLDEVFG